MIANWIITSNVSLKRIEKYLSEDEVPEYISSLTRSVPLPHEPVNTRIGCSDATFRWPAVLDNNVDKSYNMSENGLLAKVARAWGVITGSITHVLVALRLKKKKELEEEAEETVKETPFELQDVSVVFPERVISLVCGPTGSGKSSCE